jgi:hypothetical protein
MKKGVEQLKKDLSDPNLSKFKKAMIKGRIKYLEKRVNN